MENLCDCEACGHHHDVEDCPEVERTRLTFLLGISLGAAVALILYGLEALALA